MSRVKKIIHFESKDSYAIVHVLMEDGTEAQVYVGGDCQIYYHHGKIKAFVTRGKPDDTKTT